MTSCHFCSSDTGIESCISCKKPFCPEHQSHKTAIYCQECFTDVSVENKKLSKPVIKYSIKQDKIITKIKSCRHITFSGESWRLHSKLIHELTESELYDSLELTRASINLLEQEILQRRILNAQKEVLNRKNQNQSQPNQNQGKKLNIPIVKKPASVDKIANMTKAVKKLNISPEVLKAMIAKLGGN